MHDLKRLAADAERVEASAKAWLSECEGLDRDEVEFFEKQQRLAAFASDLTDQAPLTAERLVEAGGEPCDGNPGDYTFPAVDVQVLAIAVSCERWQWWHGPYRSHEICPAPRTVGHLRQLLLRMGENPAK